MNISTPISKEQSTTLISYVHKILKEIHDLPINLKSHINVPGTNEQVPIMKYVYYVYQSIDRLSTLSFYNKIN